MDRFRHILENIQAQLGSLTGSQKLLAGSLVVIALMTLFLVSQYAGGQQMVSLVNDDPNINLVQTLRGAGIDARVENDTIVVPPNQQRRAVATLAQAGQLPGDTTILFSNLMEFQDWKNPRQQNRQQYLLALQNELARVVALYPNVSSAQVFIDAPEPSGLGRAAQAPTASVNVITTDQGGLKQSSVDAIARLVSGPVSGLTPDRVEVLDPTGPRRVTNEDDLLSTSWLEHAQKVERATEQKLRSLLGDIPGVVVSVTAQVDITRVTQSSRDFKKNNEGSVAIPASETSEESINETARASAEPGVRSNQQADINYGGSTGQNSTRTNTTTDFEVGVGVTESQTYDPRGMPTYLAASVAIPQPYVEQLLLQARARAGGAGEEGGEAPAPLTDQEVQQKFDELKVQFEELLGQQLVAVGPDGTRTPGDITVKMLPVLGAALPAAAGSASFFGMSSSTASGGGVSLGPLGPVSVETLLVGLLGVVAFVLMLGMVRKAGKRVEMPDPAEIVGIPPALTTPENLVGEAAESDSVMEGIEVDESHMRIQKMLDQVNELVNENPLAASKLLGRWVETD
ncbi:MAG: flagellar M-ring protein FliF C-terminal domain-containing protein [Phycisphaerales bacterium JB040]